MAAGVYTGIMALIPALKDTSFHDITTTFECWILFAILIIVNSRSPLDSALKTFVFFLISQPLVYLVQVPFNDQGWGIFRYYPAWFYWTFFTIPMAFIGYYMKKDKWWGMLILGPMMLFLGYHYLTYFGEAVHFFPNHLLTSIFCAVTLIIYPLYIFKDKRIRIAGLIFALLIIAAASLYSAANKRSHTYETEVLLSGGSTSGVDFDDTFQVSLEDEAYGSVSITYIESIQSYAVHAAFEKTGSTVLVLQSPTGETYYYDLTIERSSYHIERKQ